MRSRLSLVADAEHELRGAATALSFAAERTRKAGATRAFASLVALQLERMGAGLADLERARRRPVARRPVFPRRPAGLRRPSGEDAAPAIDSGRLTQVVANLVANAVEHGRGPVQVSWNPTPAGGRLEVRNPNRPRELDALAAQRPARGRGVGIARRAARTLGGRLEVEAEAEETVATLELPARTTTALPLGVPAEPSDGLPDGSPGGVPAESSARAA